MPSLDITQPCWVYKSRRHQEMYLFLSAKDGLETLPDPLRQHFGEAEFVMQLELSPGRRLARAEITEVLAALRDQGFYLQLPPKIEARLYHGE